MHRYPDECAIISFRILHEKDLEIDPAGKYSNASIDVHLLQLCLYVD